MKKRLGGRYELQEQIGDGGMAIVYRALDTLLGRQVAVKMLRTQYARDEEFVRRFRQEAQSAAKLSHPNIVSLFDVGVTPDEEYYIVMEYVDGSTLKDVIRERSPLSVREAVNITRQICDALECAHDHHIIHRDIKPHNILISKTGLVKVTDFGIARALTNNTITHHDSRAVLGSVHYFSPEQARGGATDVKSDIYSLGVVMYEMLTGKLPFSGDSAVSVALKHLRSDFIEPRELNPEIPQSVENIILRCLVKSKDARYPDMRALKADLQDALIHPDVPKFVMPEEDLDATIAVPAVGGIGHAASEKLNSEKDNRPTGRRWLRGLMWTGVGLLILGIGAVAAYYIVMSLTNVPDVPLPNVVGMTEKDAIAKLNQAGFKTSQITEHRGSNLKPKGTVYEQDPPGPTTVKEGRTITLYISTGPPQVIMPNLQGEPVDQAVQTLINLGFSENKIKEVSVPNTQDAGTVISSNPPVNASVTVDTPVELQVSEGGQTTVPYILGMTLDDARKALQSAHLQLGQVTMMQAPGQDHTVFRIVTYSIGQKVPYGTPIDVYVVDNSGESGGGIGDPNNTTQGDGTGDANTTDNSTGNDITGANAKSLPPNTQVRPVEIVVSPTSAKPVHVQIFKSDVRGEHQPFVDTTITEKTYWTVPVYVTPDTSGQIVVYENGRMVQNQPVTYQG
jgi:eukaryotic-like serine/threonine-protein kinase